MRVLFVVFALFLLQACDIEQNSLMEENDFKPISLNEEWIFEAEGLITDTVDLPHTPRFEPLVVNDQWQGRHSYTKTLIFSDEEVGNTFLHFEGVMHEAEVFLNGKKIKEHSGGYLPFSVNLKDFMVTGENTLRVEVCNSDNAEIPPGKPLDGLDFNYYGGIYRDVWLTTKKELFITDPFIENTGKAGWLVHFDTVSIANAKGSLQLQLRNDSDMEREMAIKVVLSHESSMEEFGLDFSILPQQSELVYLPIQIDSPMLWSTQNPNLYEIQIQLLDKRGKEYDRLNERIGIRSAKLTMDGFFLNGEKVFIRGTNRHQEYPYVGYAISNNANFRDALKIKNAGFDLVRLSHYPQDKSFLEACDELGLMVMNAIPGWQHFEEGAFVENSLQDIREMIRRDRNHPSVIFWEVSLNESGMSEDYIKKATTIVAEELPFEDVITAGWMDHPSYDLFIPARQHASPPHYWNQYKDGQRSIFIAEYGDWEYYAHNAGFNQSAFADLSDEERNSRQLRSSGEQGLLQQAMNFQEAANSNRRGTGTIGHANWLMFDYNRGYADDLEASGISDIFRIPKFTYYFYQSQRSPAVSIDHPLVEQGPMVKIASYWTKESQKAIRVFSNCEQVSLLLNDSLIATKEATRNQFSDQLPHPPFEFKIDRFEAGKLVAIGLLQGKDAARDSVTTPGKAHGLRIKADTLGGIEQDPRDIVFVYAEIVDSAGELVTTANRSILFDLSGPGELIGENPIKAEAGIATILYKGELNGINMRIHAAGLASDSINN